MMNIFYINHIYFKNDPEKTRNVALLLSMSFAGILILLTYKSIIDFCVGRSIGVFDYLYILLLVYLIVNVFIAFKIDGTNEVTFSPIEHKETKVFQKNTAKKNGEGFIIDDFIFNNKVFYDNSKSRGNIIPDFGNEGLEYEEEEKEITESVLDIDNATEDSSIIVEENTNSHENISFPEEKQNIEESEDFENSEKLKKQRLLNERLSNDPSLFDI
jgi:hypothetical protein